MKSLSMLHHVNTLTQSTKMLPNIRSHCHAVREALIIPHFPHIFSLDTV